MSEVLFILTTIYVAYVIYRVADEQKAEMLANKLRGAASSAILTPSGLTTTTEATATTEVKESAPVVEVKEEVKTASASDNMLRDPETGETAKISNNYRGLKRWLKEALVTEGLLEKVYSNSELNDETNAKIKQALAAIRTMSKYHA